LDEEIVEGDHIKTKQTDPKKKKSKAEKEQNSEFGLSRGIDFQNVSNVINFDFPTSEKQYIHRAGRTARGDNKGTHYPITYNKYT
jgi:ATP-dependent RNA helicase DDX56/DBP9